MTITLRTNIGSRLLAAVLSSAALMTLVGPAPASETCGLTCPVCTGDLSADGLQESAPVIPHGNVSVFVLWSTDQHDTERERGSATLMTGWRDRLELGLTYGFPSEEWRLRFKFAALLQRGLRPAVALGVGNFRPGSTESNIYGLLNWGSFGSALPRAGGYIGIGSEIGHPEPQLFAGLSYFFGGRTGGMVSFDGREPHAGLMTSPTSGFNIGLMALEMKTPAPMAGWRGKLPWLSGR